MRTAFFWVITRRVSGQFLTDFSGHPIGPIFGGQDSARSPFVTLLSRRAQSGR